MTPARATGFRSADELPAGAREALAATLLALADNKRILGMRYAEWILGAPTLEAGIACSAMAQDEWGHGRILYATLRDFGTDPGPLEHEREADAYLSSELLDAPVEEWPDLLALNLLFDAALSVQVESLTSSRYEPIHFKTRKLLEEERFHFEHGRGWTLRLAETAAGREALSEAFRKVSRPCLHWFGRSDGAWGRALKEAELADADPDELRARWADRVAPVLREAGLGDLADEMRSGFEPDWSGWDDERRRAGAGGPHPETLARIRGDRNRSMLMD
ncbi:MAG: Phenylacetic acid catabolic protein [Gemmatimonadota bacterium]